MADSVILYEGPLVSRKEAKERGLKRYFTGKPCPHGHVCERWTSATGCYECARIRRVNNPDLNYERVKAWRALHPEKRAEEARRWRAKYPEKAKEISERHRAKHIDRIRKRNAETQRNKRKSDPEGNRKRIAAFKARHETALAEIAGRPRPNVCDLCEGRSKIVFDHCHVSGEFRGWICDRCNKVLGLVKDSVILLRGMADYVEENNGSTDNREA